MTTIAFDGKTLAGDKRTTIGGVRSTITKIRRGATGNLVGFAGLCSLSEGIFAWLCEGGERPEGQTDSKDWASIIEVTPEGDCYKHERYGRFLIEDEFFAVGTGASFALAGMALGLSAMEAVELAARFDTATGDGVDVLALHPENRPARRPAKSRRRR